MINKIKVDIFGIWDEVLQNNKNGCGGCGSGGDGCGCGKKSPGIAIKGINEEGESCSGGCGSKKSKAKTTGEQFNNLKNFIDDSDVKDNAEITFYDLRKINVLDYEDIRLLTEMDYEAPFVIVDGIVRYYGGISADLVYKDIVELIE